MVQLQGTDLEAVITETKAAPSLRVLIVGYRSGLGRALRAAGIPFAIWNDKPIKWPANCLYGMVGDLGLQVQSLRLSAEHFLPFGPFTHVIAAKESGVFAASVARRVLGARQSKNTVVLRCRDKLLMKRHLQKAGIPMAAFLSAKEAQDAEDVFRKLKAPIVSKERWRSGGRGLKVVSTPEELKETLGRTRLVEEFVNAPEMSVETFVDNKQILFESTTFYYQKGFTNLVPSGLAPGKLEEVLALNRAVIKALGISWGMTHLEVYLTERGPLFGEIALRPPGGYIMNCLEVAWGFNPWDALVAIELDQKFAFPEAPVGCASAMVLHPGAGRVVTVEGWENVVGSANTVKAKLKVEPGMQLAARTGVGDDVGYIISKASTREEMVSCLESIAAGLKILTVQE